MLAGGVSQVFAACGGGDEDFAEFYGPYAQVIVLGRYEGLALPPPPSASRVVEPGGGNVAVVRVLQVYRGTSGETVEVHPNVLGDCTAPTEPGERILLAFIEDSPSGSFVGSWHEDDRGRWWHHFDRYRDLQTLLSVFGVLPDTATSAGSDGAFPVTPSLLSIVTFLTIGLGSMLLMLRMLGSRHSTISVSRSDTAIGCGAHGPVCAARRARPRRAPCR